MWVNGGVPKNPGVERGLGFFCYLGVCWGRFLGFLFFDNLPHDYLIQVGAVISILSNVLKFFYRLPLNRNLYR